MAAQTQNDDRRGRTLSSADLMRQPPVDPGMELELLRLMVVYGDEVIEDALEVGFTLWVFSDYWHREAGKAILDLHTERESVSIVSVRSRMLRNIARAKVGDAESDDKPEGKISALIADISAEHPGRKDSASWIVEQLRDLDRLRHLAKINADLYHRAYDRKGDYSELIGELEEKVFQMTESSVRNRDQVVTAVDVGETLDQIDQQTVRGKRMAGLSTGLYMLDDLTNGFKPGEITCIAARPSMGKTALGMNIVENMSIGGDARGLVYSLEMGKRALMTRLIASLARVDSRRINAGLLRTIQSEKIDGEWGRISRCAGYVAQAVESRLAICHRSTLRASEIGAKARRLKKAWGRLDYVLVDYLTLMEEPQRRKGGGYDSRNLEIGYIARQLAALSKSLNIHVFVLAQLNRPERGRDTERPRMHRLRDSGEIEQHMDNVLLIHRPDYYSKDSDKPDNPGLVELILDKQRNGPTGLVHAVWVKQWARFENPLYRGGTSLYDSGTGQRN